MRVAARALRTDAARGRTHAPAQRFTMQHSVRRQFADAAVPLTFVDSRDGQTIEVEAEVGKTVLEAALDQAPEALAAFPSDGHRDHPASSLWRPEARHNLTAYLSGDRRSLNGLLQEISACRVVWPANSAGAFVNLNTPDDLARCDETTVR